MTRNLENLESFKMLKCEEKEEKNIEILERSWSGVCKFKIQISKTRKIIPLRTKIMSLVY